MATPDTGARERAPSLAASNILGALHGVKKWWNMNGLAHHLVEWEKAKEIRKAHEHEEDGGRRVVVETWLQNESDPTWRKLITALERAAESEVADSIRPYAEQLSDTTMTVENVAEVMSRVKEWGKVGLTCGTPHAKIASITRSYSTHEDRCYALADFLVHTIDGISWKGLAATLYNAGEYKALEEVKKYFKVSQDPTLTTENLMKVFEGREELWTSLSKWTAVPQPKRDELANRYTSDVQRMEAFWDHWCRLCPVTSWKIIQRALEVMEEKKLAEELNEKYVRATKLSEEIFDAAMKEGYVLSRNTKVVLMGAAGTGKTCTLALIMEKPPPPQRSSTSLATRPVRVLVLEKTGNGWKLMNKKSVSHLLANEALAYHAKNPDSSQNRNPTESSGTHWGRLSSFFSYMYTYIRGNSSDRSTTTDKRSIADDVSLQIDSARVYVCDTETRETEPIEMIHVIDSGGQTQFHEVLPVFLKGASLFLFVHSLQQSLSDHPEVCYYKDGEVVGMPFISPLSNEQILRHCLRVMRSQASQSPNEECPQLAFIGTHRDLEHECAETREDKNKKLLSMLRTTCGPKRPLDDYVISFGESMERLIFPLNAKNPEDDDHRIAVQLRKVIESCRHETERIPLQYHSLDIAICKFMDTAKREVLTLAECLEEVKHLHFDEEKLYEALMHLHKLNHIFYLEKLGLILGNAQIPLDKLTELLELLYSTAEGTAVHNLERKLRAQGIISENLLRNFHKHYIDGLFGPSELLVLFEGLMVVANIGDGEYLMPCLLPADKTVIDCPDTCTQDEGRPPSIPSDMPAVEREPQDTIPPLLLYFPDGGPLLGQFCLLIAYLLSTAKWTLLCDHEKIVKVTRNCVKFRVPWMPCTVTLCDPFSTYFKVCVDSVDSEAAHPFRICQNIRDTILDGLRKGSKLLHYEYTEPEVAFLCQRLECWSKPHPAFVNTDYQMLVCSEKRQSKMNDGHRRWLGISDRINNMEELTNLPGRDRVINIPREIGDNYKDFGTHLLQDNHGTIVDSLIRDHCNDPVKINTAILTRWIKGSGSTPTTWPTLALALEDADLKNLASDIRTAKGLC